MRYARLRLGIERFKAKKGHGAPDAVASGMDTVPCKRDAQTSLSIERMRGVEPIEGVVEPEGFFGELGVGSV